MSRRRSIWLLPAAVLAATAFAGAPALAQDDPEELVIGFVPSVEAGALVEDIQPLADYLTETLGIPVAGFVSSDYAALVTAMETGQAQIAALPPFGLVQAVDVAGAEMILQSERFGSPSYHTQFITTDAGQVLSRRARLERASEGDEMVAVLNCNGTDACLRRGPQGPHRPRRRRAGRARYEGLLRGTDLIVGLHLPGHHLRQRRTRPRDGPRRGLRRRP